MGNESRGRYDICSLLMSVVRVLDYIGRRVRGERYGNVGWIFGNVTEEWLLVEAEFCYVFYVHL